MAVDGSYLFVILAVWVVMIAVVAFVLYVIVRFGVKHGIRSYYSDRAQHDPEPDRPPA